MKLDINLKNNCAFKKNYLEKIKTMLSDATAYAKITFDPLGKSSSRTSS